jgi:hypothetical protein
MHALQVNFGHIGAWRQWWWKIKQMHVSEQCIAQMSLRHRGELLHLSFMLCIIEP